MPFEKTPLARIKDLDAFAASGLPEPYVDGELPSLGISSVEDFLGLLATLPGAVAAQTGADPEGLRALAEEALASLVPPANRRLLETVPHRLTPFGGGPEETPWKGGPGPCKPQDARRTARPYRPPGGLIQFSKSARMNTGGALARAPGR